VAANLKTVDANEDGAITKEELNHAADEKMSETIPEVVVSTGFDAIDVNQDGTITKTELEDDAADLALDSANNKVVAENFNAVDENKDGAVNAQELSKLAEGAASEVAPVEAAPAPFIETGTPKDFEGSWTDPRHPGGYRKIELTSRGHATVTGKDEEGEAEWSVSARVKEHKMMIDFSSKGGPAKMRAKLDNGVIVFRDGNKWSRQ